MNLSNGARRWIVDATGASSITAVRHIQRLWSGYGAILRIGLEGAPVPSVVAKIVSPPAAVEHPRGWASERSDARKRRSYAVECCWYQKWAERCGAASRVPACLAAEATEDGWRFLLEDLDAAGFDGRRAGPSNAEIEACLAWLARFHATFLGVDPEGLWPIGTYWHLATRPDELAVMDDPALSAAAAAIDERLSGARYKTLVHGDAKVANFCFSSSKEVAAVDFQYVGGGCGMKDVAYLLGGAATARTRERHEAAWLEGYFRHLRGALPASVDGAALEAEWRALYPFAWADFSRFLAGWAPEHPKLDHHAARWTNAALDVLRG